MITLEELRVLRQQIDALRAQIDALLKREGAEELTTQTSGFPPSRLTRTG